MVIAYSRNLCATLEAVLANIKTYSGYARAMLQMREPDVCVCEGEKEKERLCQSV